MPNDVLLKAAELIEDNGLYQSGSDSTNPCRTCVVIALDDAALFYKVSLREATQLVCKVADHLGLSYLKNPNTVIFKWNDTPGRTAEEVVRVLREVAELE